MTGVDPSQIASQQARSKFDELSPLMKAGLGGSKTGKLGEEAQTQTKEVMTAIQSLVDLMKSAVLVN
jgi:hypothetical protein